MKKRMEQFEKMWFEVIPPKCMHFTITTVKPVEGKKNILEVIYQECCIILN